MSSFVLKTIPSDSINAPADGSVTLFFDTDEVLKFKQPNGTVVPIGSFASDATPKAIGVAAPGTSGQFSRADHVHSHGNQVGGSLHAGATPSSSGFLSSSDKAYIDAAKGIISAFGGFAPPIRTETGAYTITAADYTVLADASSGPFTITLPAAENGSQMVKVKKIDSSSNIVTVEVDSLTSDTIDGESSFDLIVQYEAVTLQSNNNDGYVAL